MIIASNAFSSKHEFLTFLIENILFAILIICGPLFQWLKVIFLLQLCQQGHVCVSVLYHLCWMFVCAFACHLLQSSLISWETKKKKILVTCHTIHLDFDNKFVQIFILFQYFAGSAKDTNLLTSLIVWPNYLESLFRLFRNS